MRNTQNVLDWFYSLEKGISYNLYDSTWLNAIPNPTERQTILDVLINHYLIVNDEDNIQISAKGREYVEWRGELPTISS